MGINRYNSPRVYTFDAGSRTSLEPVVGNFSDYMTNLPGGRLPTVQSMLRSAVPGGFANQMFSQPLVSGGGAAYFTFFGVPSSAEVSEYTATYYSSRVSPTMPKHATNYVYATFILSMPNVASTTNTTSPVVNAGLSSVTAATATNSYVNFQYNGTHTSTAFNMGLNMVGPSSAQTTGNITAATEYPCWVSITAAGLLSANIAGLTCSSIALTATSGNFWVAIGGASLTTTNSASIRALRVSIG